jgi:hypothetical protein
MSAILVGIAEKSQQRWVLFLLDPISPAAGDGSSWELGIRVLLQMPAGAGLDTANIPRL